MGPKFASKLCDLRASILQSIRSVTAGSLSLGSVTEHTTSLRRSVRFKALHEPQILRIVAEEPTTHVSDRFNFSLYVRRSDQQIAAQENRSNDLFCAAAIQRHARLLRVILDRGEWGLPVDRRLLHPGSGIADLTRSPRPHGRALMAEL